MRDPRRDAHAAQAKRAGRLAVKARERIVGARAAAELHERLGSDPVAGEGHRRAAAFYRDAQLIYGQAAALQGAHAAHERQAAETLASAHHRLARHRHQPPPTPSGPSDRYAALVRREALADQRDRAVDARELVVDERERHADTRELAGDERDRSADKRELAADERDRIADTRDRVADDRDAVASARADQIDAREREFNEALPYLRLGVEQRAQLARVHAAIVRTRQRVVKEEKALHRDDPQAAVDETAIDRHLAGVQRRQPPEPA
jgi:hypothetical protein